MAKLNQEGQALFAKLEAAESSGRKLNPEGQRLLAKFRQVQGAELPASAPETPKDPPLGEGLKSDISRAGEILKKGPTRFIREELLKDPTLKGAYSLVN